MIGIDEAGRGAWAGPLVAAAVFLQSPIVGLTDSKLLTRLQRIKLAEEIRNSALVGIGWVSPVEIDELGLTAATSLAMEQALAQIKHQDIEIIIDGHLNYLPKFANVKTLIRADLLVPAVSAASIVAKVARDQFMTEIAQKFPKYGFEKHVGYGTRLHQDMLKSHGICELHRKSYRP